MRENIVKKEEMIIEKEDDSYNFGEMVKKETKWRESIENNNKYYNYELENKT